MWKDYIFPEYPDCMLKYRSDNAFFFVQCQCDGTKLQKGTKLYMSSENSDNCLCLGSFSEDENAQYHINKSYPLQYLKSYGIHALDALNFSLHSEFPMMTAGEKTCKEETDGAVIRAQKALDSMNPGVDYAKQQEEATEKIQKAIIALNIIQLPFLSAFTCYSIKDFKQSFELSVFGHILHAQSFVEAFIQSEVWYLGVCSDRIHYAVCIPVLDNMPNPMINALDCTDIYRIPNDKLLYYTVGVALLRDGQYFYRISDWENEH